MKIAIYTPYLDAVGGGERYMLTIAQTLAEFAEVDVLLDTHLSSLDIPSILARIERLQNLDLSKVRFIKAPLGASSSFLSRVFFLRKYDWLIALTDGSIFFSTAKTNILHFQVPFENFVPGLGNRLKLSSWKQAIYNSKFTQEIVEKHWPIKGQVIYPPVSIKQFKLRKKKEQIISIGRFFGFTKSKKHEVMIEGFRQLSANISAKGWSLHLCGGAANGDLQYIEQLKRLAKGLPVHLHPNIPFDQLVELTGESAIYWHAAGYGESDPKLFEHFGISTVEAMAAGCVPVVINLGGQREIVNSGENGYLWNTLTELQEQTLRLIKDPKLLKKMSQEAKNTSEQFSEERFKSKIRSIVNGTS